MVVEALPFILLLPFAVVAWYSRAWGLWLLLAAVQLYTVRFVVWGIPTTLLELGIYVVAVCVFFRGDLVVLRELPTVRRSWLFVVIVLWLVAALLGLLIAPDIRLAAGILKGWIIDPLLLAVLCVVVLARAREPKAVLRFGVLAIVIGAAATTVQAIGQQIFLHQARLQSGFDSPNTLAMYLVAALVMGLLWLLGGDEWKRINVRMRVGWVSLLVVLLYGVIGTGSYGAGLALLVGLGYGFSVTHLSRLVRSLMISLVVVAGIAMPFVYVQQGSWFGPSHYNATYGLSSGEVRLTLWKYATEEILRRPVFGIGLGQWQPMFMARATSDGLLSYRKPGLAIELIHASLFPHNLWLATWLQLGLLGVVVLVGLSYISLSAPVALGPFGAPMAGVVMATLIHGIVDTPLYRNDLSVMWWVVVLVGVTTTYLARRNPVAYG